jgi:hypothetical protein
MLNVCVAHRVDSDSGSCEAFQLFILAMLLVPGMMTPAKGDYSSILLAISPSLSTTNGIATLFRRHSDRTEAISRN